ncbi:MAG: tRNA (adenosine(37)-N6)-threonylcarbamoyltransferase complex transferase subunit TsaD [Phycisphaerales bacterium]|nr:tRNA (adenosine(37)-N6)-threonylcarbamoyltransferase complex transferase subunit TsaD [Phycisphaerales bacterium]
MTLMLGIESSCDETAAAVVDGDRCVRSSIVASQHDLHEVYAGVVPEVASRAHLECISPVIRQACRDAGVALQDIDAIAVGNAPGLIGSLLVGTSAAKALAWSLGVPLIGVHHVLAHLHAAALDAPPLPLPAVGLVASGGHTHVYRLDDDGTANALTWTIDDAIGEAFDKAGTMLRAGYPGGPAVEALAATGDGTGIDLPIGRPKAGGFSFSGLKTALLYALRGQPRRVDGTTVFPRELDDVPSEVRANHAAAFQSAAVAGLERGLRAALNDAGEFGALIAGGGVIANTAVRSMLERVASDAQVPLRLPTRAYCVDNAAMIAGAGLAQFERGHHADLHLQALARLTLGVSS